MFALALGFLVSSCGKKVDEAMVAEFNAKKTEAEKLIADAETGMKSLHDDHAAWGAKLDEAAKLPGMDTAKIAAFKAEIANHMKMSADMAPIVDSLKGYINAKTDNADAVKGAIAGLTSNIAVLTSNWKTMTDAHAKLGADITAFLAPAPAAATIEAAKPAVKKPTTNQGGTKKDAPAAPAAPKPATKSEGGIHKK